MTAESGKLEKEPRLVAVKLLLRDSIQDTEGPDRSFHAESDEINVISSLENKCNMEQ